jgi:hypothetical protein
MSYPIKWAGWIIVVRSNKMKQTYSVKFTKSQFGPETPIIECEESFAILSRFVRYVRIDRPFD